MSLDSCMPGLYRGIDLRQDERVEFLEPAGIRVRAAPDSGGLRGRGGQSGGPAVPRTASFLSGDLFLVIMLERLWALRDE